MTEEGRYTSDDANVHDGSNDNGDTIGSNDMKDTKGRPQCLKRLRVRVQAWNGLKRGVFGSERGIRRRGMGMT